MFVNFSLSYVLWREGSLRRIAQHTFMLTVHIAACWGHLLVNGCSQAVGKVAMLVHVVT